ERYKWDLEALYPDLEAWEADFEHIQPMMEPLESRRGKIDSAKDMAEIMELETSLERLVEKLYVYAHLRADENTGDDENQARMARMRAVLAELSGRLAWILPEVLSKPEETLKEWRDSDALKADRYEMVRILRRKPHTLSDSEETLLSRASEIFSAPQQTFSLLTNADMQFPDIKDENGKKKELSQGRYIKFMENRDRRVRRDAFEVMYDTYGQFRNTISSTLSTAVKYHNYMAKTRNFASALEASLHGDQIPASLYEALIEGTHQALPQFYDYVDLRRRHLGLDDIGMHDMYVPIVPEYDVEVSFEEAKRWVLEALAPLGDDYLARVEKAFSERWIDVKENRGKRSGAYSSGCYDSYPYMLLNFQGTLDSVFTLAHEMGHSIHSHLANEAQPPRQADYTIFVAEIASTLNEALLLRHLLQNSDDPRLRAYLLNHYCDSVKGTVYRQTMFAEFEKMVHEMDAEGQPLTAETLNSRYFELNKVYYGEGVEYDDRIGREWSRIPHFYYNFYVYKYATSFCASEQFVKRVLESEEKRDQYLDLLRAGGSDDPLKLVEAAGVDLSDPATFEAAFASFARTVGQLDEALDTLGK
ncbi:MAG: oligoendopeptidase F, partial [Candidatus Sumerlaeota bacterium]